MIVEPGEADHQPSVKENEIHLEELAILNDINLRPLLGKIFRGRRPISIVNKLFSGFPAPPLDLTVLHKRDEIRQQRKLVTSLAQSYDKILVTGAQYLQKENCHTNAKAFSASVSSQSQCHSRHLAV